VTGPFRPLPLDRTGLLFCNTFGIGTFGPLLPEIGRAQALPDWQLGLVASAFGFARMVAAMPVGALVARRLGATLMAAPLVLAVGLHGSRSAPHAWEPGSPRGCCRSA